jgi:DNA-binding MarR family transcriptional regulator
MGLDTTDPTLPPVGALLRRPALMVRHEVMNDLHAAGFADILPAHLGVFQYPGPDGQRPGVLAIRTRASKQAMNHLLHQLESGGYILRDPHPDDRRTRVVRLTERGWAAHSVIQQTTARLEREWYQALGEEMYCGLSNALERLQNVLEKEQPPSHRHPERLRSRGLDAPQPG